MDRMRGVAHVRAVSGSEAKPEISDELRSVLDTLPGLVWTALPEGNVDFVSRRWCEYTGLRFDENLDSAGWQVAIHPEHLPPLLAEWVRVSLRGRQQK